MANSSEFIKIEAHGEIVDVQRDRFARAQLKALREFGYPNVSLDTVHQATDDVLLGRKLNVFGVWMSKDIVVQAKEAQ